MSSCEREQQHLAGRNRRETRHWESGTSFLRAALPRNLLAMASNLVRSGWTQRRPTATTQVDEGSLAPGGPAAQSFAADGRRSVKQNTCRTDHVGSTEGSFLELTLVCSILCESHFPGGFDINVFEGFECC